MHKIALDVNFTQITTKRGIKIHGEQAISAMNKCYTQLEDMKVVGALIPENFTISQKKGLLCAINLIKEKIC